MREETGYPEPWRTLERAIAHRCSAFEVYTDTVGLPDGQTSRFDFIAEPPSVVVLGFTDETEEVIVVDEYRHAVGRVATGLPGGTVEPADDDLATAARRELREETGYRAPNVEHVLSAEPANGLLQSTRHYHRAHGCVPVTDPDRDRDETMRVRTTPFDALYEDIIEGEILDERTITAVLFERASRDRSP